MLRVAVQRARATLGAAAARQPRALRRGRLDATRAALSTQASSGDNVRYFKIYRWDPEVPGPEALHVHLSGRSRRVRAHGPGRLDQD